MWLIVENDVYDITSKRGRPSKHLPNPRSTLPHQPFSFHLVPRPFAHRSSLTSPLPAEFLDEHPGGAKILKRFAGKNATKSFWKYHNESVLKKYGAKLKIGSVGESAKL